MSSVGPAHFGKMVWFLVACAGLAISCTSTTMARLHFSIATMILTVLQYPTF